MECDNPDLVQLIQNPRDTHLLVILQREVHIGLSHVTYNLGERDTLLLAEPDLLLHQQDGLGATMRTELKRWGYRGGRGHAGAACVAGNEQITETSHDFVELDSCRVEIAKALRTGTEMMISTRPQNVRCWNQSGSASESANSNN
jgi:hypothetical protein